MTDFSLVLIVFGVVVVAFCLAFLLVRFIFLSWTSRTIKDFEMEFPGRCGVCAYYRYIVYAVPPEHDCKEKKGGP